ncbi:MAG: hypothetical protein LBD77_08620, partial [Bifidobacteriaceae bacterium]|nr:hypothetical protein [Bifidobacteriaceae bacterium]
MNRRQPSPGPARRRVAAVIGLAGLAGLVVSPLNAPPAHAASYLANAIYGLADARGWMSEDVTAEVDLLKVLAADPTGEIAVAVAPPEALLEIGAAEMAQELLWGTDW